MRQWTEEARANESAASLASKQHGDERDRLVRESTSLKTVLDETERRAVQLDAVVTGLREELAALTLNYSSERIDTNFAHQQVCCTPRSP